MADNHIHSATNSTMDDNHIHILYLAKRRQVVGRREGKAEPGGRAGQGAVAKTCKLKIIESQMHRVSKCIERSLKEWQSLAWKYAQVNSTTSLFAEVMLLVCVCLVLTILTYGDCKS